MTNPKTIISIIRVLSLIGFVVLCFGATSAQVKPPKSVVDFTYNGKKINPRILQEFLGFASSDRYSSIREVDLTIGNESNRFYVDWSLVKSEKINHRNYISYTPSESERDCLYYESIRYAYLGTCKNGTYLVLFDEFSGGTLNEHYLLELKLFEETSEQDNKPHVYIKCLKKIGLEAQSKVTPHLKKNEVEIIADGTKKVFLVK